MDSRNCEDMNHILDVQAMDLAREAGISFEEAQNRLSTVDPANAYRHWIEDSIDGNGRARREDGCLWLIVASPLIAILSGVLAKLA